MGIFFRSFPSKKEPKDASGPKQAAPAKPETQNTGRVSEYELKNYVNRELSQKFDYYDRKKIQDVLSGHMDTDSHRISDYKNVDPQELKAAAETLKKNHGWSDEKVKKFTEAMGRQM